MKLGLNKPFALLPLVAACGAFNAHAQQVVTFQGEVALISCNATVTTGGGTVSLPLATSDQLTGVGSTTGDTTFVVGVTGCGANPGVTAKVYFYNTTANAVTGGRLNTNPALGWQFQILPATGTAQLDVGTSATPSAPSAIDPGGSIASGSANITYRVRYYQSAALAAGSASATANFVLQYI